MGREEFLKILRESLETSLEKVAINEQLDYYDKYISDEIKKGRTEKEVLEELGDPRLIAKTIKTVNVNDNSTINRGESEDSKNTNGNYSGRQTNNNSYSGYGQSNRGNRSYSGYINNNGTIGCIIAGLVIFIVVYGILSFMGRLAYGVGELAFSGPIGFIIVLGLFYLFFGRGRK